MRETSRRSVTAAAAAATGLVIVVAAHSTGGASLPGGTVAPAGRSSTGGGSAGSSASSGASPGSGTSAGSAGPPPSGGGSTPPGTSGSASATGATEQYGYGQLAVRVTVASGKITDVTVATLQTAETYSQQLADAVIPTLRQEVLSAQSANISSVSGATYTADAYASSLQSALDKIGFK
jgi:hypothetical protein